MKIILSQFFFLIIVSLSITAQVTSKDLDGEWLIRNQDNSNNHKDTIQLFKGVDYEYDSERCNIVIWDKHKKDLRISFIGNCADSGSILNYNRKRKIKLRKKDDYQIIEIRAGRKLIGSFKILSLETKQVFDDNKETSVLILEQIKLKDMPSIESDGNEVNGPSVWYYGYIYQFL